jgi:parallel beta helix pectate lyase-like protein
VYPDTGCVQEAALELRSVPKYHRSLARVPYLVIATAVLAVCLQPATVLAAGRDDKSPQAPRDDTASLQGALDAGGRIVLKKLPDGACYQAYGLWVSKSTTRIEGESGACIQYLGPGPVRLFSNDGDPIASNAIFFVNRSSTGSGPPQKVSISNLKLNVPNGTDGYGVLVAGNDVTLSNLKITGSPLDAVTVTGRANGRGYAGPVVIKGSRFIGARRNGISVVGAIGVTIDSNTIKGAGNQTFLGLAPVSYTGPWAGIDLEPDTVSYPIKNVTVSNNTISDNGGAGILMALATNFGLPTVADKIKLAGNTITRNGQSSGPFLRGGICLQGGQANGSGRLSVTSNQIVANGGFGLCRHPEGFNMQISLSKNMVRDNSDGDSAW